MQASCWLVVSFTKHNRPWLITIGLELYHVHCLGSGGPTKILMYHTFGFSSTSWNVYEGLAEELEARGFNVYRVDDPHWKSRALWQDISKAAEFENLIDAFKPDLIHVHSIRTTHGFLLVRAAHKSHIPILATVHTYRAICPITLRSRINTLQFPKPCNLVYPHPDCFKCVSSGSLSKSFVKSVETPFYMYILRQTYRNMNAIVSPSKSLADLLTQIGLNNVLHIPNMINKGELEFYSSKALAKEYPSSILFVGRLSREKGVELIPKIARQLLGTQVHVIGSGPLHRWLSDHNPGNLILHGFTSEHEKYSLMSKCSLLFVPSIWADLYPTVILEAFALGKPVVAFDYAGSREMVELSGGGVLAVPFDVNSMILAIRSLLDNPALSRKKGLLGHEWANRTAHPDIVVNRLIAVYEHLVGSTDSTS